MRIWVCLPTVYCICFSWLSFSYPFGGWHVSTSWRRSWLLGSLELCRLCVVKTRYFLWPLRPLTFMILTSAADTKIVSMSSSLKNWYHCNSQDNGKWVIASEDFTLLNCKRWETNLIKAANSAVDHLCRAKTPAKCKSNNKEVLSTLAKSMIYKLIGSYEALSWLFL